METEAKADDGSNSSPQEEASRPDCSPPDPETVGARQVIKVKGTRNRGGWMGYHHNCYFHRSKRRLPPGF
jgi:hypothetical protein